MEKAKDNSNMLRGIQMENFWDAFNLSSEVADQESKEIHNLGSIVGPLDLEHMPPWS